MNPFFEAALKEAAKAPLISEIPIGAVLVKDGKIIARAFNSTESKLNFTCHAEMLVIAKACRKLKTKYLNDCELFITLEPCPMCRGAIRLTRLKSVHYLLKSKKFGARGSAMQKTTFKKIRSPLAQSAEKLLKDFFSTKR